MVMSVAARMRKSRLAKKSNMNDSRGREIRHWTDVQSRIGIDSDVCSYDGEFRGVAHIVDSGLTAFNRAVSGSTDRYLAELGV